MENLSRGVIEGNGHVTNFVVERTRPVVKVCEMHGDDCVVNYSGRACPMCLLADEFDEAQHDKRDMEHTISSLECDVKNGRAL